MANNTHGVVHTTHCACWDVDAYNYAGIAETDIDNGTFVVLGDIKNTDNVIDEYTFEVAVDANGTSTIKYIVDSPVVGSTLEMQLYGDPRYFYNVAGRPMSVKQIVVGDEIELIGENFTTGAAPTDQPTYTLASIGATGKLQMVQQSGAFKLLGKKTISIGQELVPSYVFRYMG